MVQNKSGGFTLFELIIVLVIAGFISLLAIPRLFNSLTHVELKSTVRKTAALLHQARDIAYFQKKKIKVSFDMQTHRISVLQQPENNDAQWSMLNQYPLEKGIRITKCKKKEDEILHGMFDVFFSPNGNSSGGAVTIANIKNRSYVIMIDLITGHAAIKE